MLVMGITSRILHMYLIIAIIININVLSLISSVFDVYYQKQNAHSSMFIRLTFLYHFISLYLKCLGIKQYLSVLRNKIFLKYIVHTKTRLVPPNFNATGCPLWSAGCGKSKPSVVNSMEESPSWITSVQVSRTEYIMKCFHDMIDHISQKRIYDPDMNGNSIVYIGDFTF